MAFGITRRSATTYENKAEVPSDQNIPDNYVQHTLTTTKALPPITWSNLLSNINWTTVPIIGVTTILSIYGPMVTTLQWKTGLFAVFWYFVTGLGITAGEFSSFSFIGGTEEGELAFNFPNYYS